MAKAKIPTTKVICPNCHGSGRISIILGSKMRELRQAANISVRAMAGRIDVSPMYLSDLELGRRMFSERLAERFLEEVGRG